MQDRNTDRAIVVLVSYAALITEGGWGAVGLEPVRWSELAQTSRIRYTVAGIAGAGYGLAVPAARSPTPEDAVSARQILLSGLSRDADLADLLTDVERLHPRNNTFPGEVFLHLAADALAWAGVSAADRLPLEGTRERFLPGFSARGRDRRKLQYAVLAAAALHGGAEPDLLDEVVWWQADDFWQYALLAAVMYVRAAADRAGVPVRQACQELARPAGVPGTGPPGRPPT